MKASENTAREPIELAGVNAMPAPTWSWLKMNETTVQIPAGLATAPSASVRVEDPAGVTGGAKDTFTAGLAALNTRYTARRESAPGDAADRARVDENTELDVPAVSRYQEGAILLEEELSPSEAFETGMGAEAFSYMRDRACAPVAIDVPAGAHAAVTVRVNGADGAVSVASIDAGVASGASLDLVIALDSPAAGTGVVGSSLRIVAGGSARVNVSCVQTLDDGWIALDDTGIVLDEGARASFKHEVLGAGQSYTGLAGDLLGDRSRVDIDTDYLGAREQVRDFNYELRHRGRKTECQIDANGVLCGHAQKTLRGTIDLVHGCKGSQGNERETVLLANEGVRNKTVPVILCDEDDVAGNHGATIGHVRPEQLFYLATRGISPAAAEDLFVLAKLEDAAIAAPDEQIRAGVVRLGNQLIDNFEEEIA